MRSGLAAKRLFDIVISCLALCVLSPVLIVVAVLIHVRLGSPVLFRHARPGLHGRTFELVKFRTMSNATGPDGALLPNAERLTPFGRLLRSTSLDELPELWNVLIGDMSLVGPRPLLVDYLPLYSPHHARRHDVRPGITGLAQVSGRNAIGWEQKFTLDVAYIDNWSFWLDLKILFKTVWKAVGRKDINQSEAVTAERFRGYSTGNTDD